MPSPSYRCSAILIFLVACSPEPKTTSLGIVARLADGQACMAVPDSNLAEGQQFQVASIPLAGEAGKPESGLIEVTAVHPGTCVGLWGGYGWADYLVRDVPGSAHSRGEGPAIALVGGAASFSASNGSLHVDADGDGVIETFRSCTSQEGLHLTLWAGMPQQGTRIWHHYFPLGYDVEPDCSPADFEGS